MGRAIRLSLAVLVLLVPAAVSAQQTSSAVIAGVVRDTSGAVMPGVTVEAASPALIGKVRAGVIEAAEAAGGGAQTAGAAAIPRTRDGKPDFSGIWQAMNTGNFDLQDHSAQPGVPAGRGIVEGNELPYLQAALKKKQENYAARATADPECEIPGMPRVMYMPFPFHIFQEPNEWLLLFEYVSQSRNLYIGSPHPKGPIEWWMGDSRGKWDGDTMVVDLTYFNDNTWFDRVGNFHSDALHLVERWSLADRDHINYEATIDDPKVFSRPWKMSFVFYRRVETNARILDYMCYAFPLEKYYPYPSVSVTGAAQ